MHLGVRQLAQDTPGKIITRGGERPGKRGRICCKTLTLSVRKLNLLVKLSAFVRGFNVVCFC